MLFDAAHHAGSTPRAIRVAPRTGVLTVVPFEGLARFEVEEGARRRG
ncbi:hypothetical protein [Candidatus Palauibacter sp.]